MYLNTINIKHILLVFLIYFNFYSECNDIKHIKIKNPNVELSDIALSKIINLSNPTDFMKILDNILIPRVPGTDGHTKVREYIIKSMKNLDWKVERDTFTDKTPHGNITFENIIATQNPLAKRFLLLACHYDSKYFENSEFLGATDSAVPCAMMINLANVMNEFFKFQNKQTNANDIGLMFVFFDGEEAFVEWGPTDSIYGARHLAAKWESEGFLKKINMLMLLDLLGAPDPKFYSFFRETEDSYIKLLKIEESLSNFGALERYVSSGIINRSQQNYFQQRSASLYVEDDHIPFLKRNVPILHLITVPFPEVWHTPEDNKSNIDFTTVENLNKIFRVFVTEYMQINVND